VLIPVGKMQHNATLQQARVQQLEALQPPFSVLLVRCITLQHTATCCNTSTNSCATAGGAATRHVWRVHLYYEDTTYCNTLQHTATLPRNQLQQLEALQTVMSAMLIYISKVQRTAAHCSAKLQHTATYRNRNTSNLSVHRAATHCNVLQKGSQHYFCTNALHQHTVTHCNALQEGAK